MKKYRFALLLALSLIIAAAVIAFGNGNVKASGVSIGQPVADFKLPDVEGHEHTLASLKGKNGTVIIFLSAQCPVVRARRQRHRHQLQRDRINRRHQAPHLRQPFLLRRSERQRQ